MPDEARGRGRLKAVLSEHGVLIAIVLLALGLRLWGLKFDMPYFVMQPDEENVVVRALRFGYGDLNPHWFLYPTLYLYVSFVLYSAYFAAGFVFGFFASARDFSLAFFRDPTVFYLLPRTLSALAGSATVLVTYLAAVKLFERKRYGLLSALFLAVSFYHVKYSHLAKPDAAMTLLVMLAFLFSVRFYRDGRPRDSLLAGLFAGLGISVKYPAGAALLPLALAHFFNSAAPLRRRLPLLGRSLAAVGGAFLAGTPYALLDPAAFSDWLNWARGLKGAVCRGQDYAGFSGYRYYLLRAFPESSGLPLCLASSAGLPLTFLRNAKDGLMLAAFPLAFLFYMGNSYTFLDSYFLPCVPFLAIAAAVCAGMAAEALKSVKAGAALAVLLLLPSLGASLRQLYQFSLLNTQVVAKSWIEKNAPQGSRILSTINGIPPLNMTPGRVNEILACPRQGDKALGPASGDTGRGAYYAYLKENPRLPSYYFTGLHLREASEVAEALRDFDFDRYKDYDYIVLVPAAFSSDAAGCPPPVMAPAGLKGGPEGIYAGYYKFLRNVEGHSLLAADIGGKYYDEALEKPPGGKALFGLFGRAGPRILIYKVRKAGGAKK
jgi:hypothetical protein